MECTPSFNSLLLDVGQSFVCNEMVLVFCYRTGGSGQNFFHLESPLIHQTAFHQLAKLTEIAERRCRE